MRKALLILALLSGCVSYDSGSDSSSSESTETTEIRDSQVNQPTVTTVSGGGATVDASNRPQNAVSDSEELLEGNPCETLLWKPVSESDGSLAIVSAVGDVVEWSSVQVETVGTAEEPGEVEFCEFAGLTPEGDRQVWRCSEPGEAYTGAFVIEFGGGSCTGEVTDPSARND